MELKRCGCADSYLADDYEMLMAAADRIEALLRATAVRDRVAAQDAVSVPLPRSLYLAESPYGRPSEH